MFEGNLEEVYGSLLDKVIENLDNDLLHYGVKGMKWGQRKSDSNLVGLGPDKITRKTKSGDTVTLSKTPPNLLNKGFAKLSKRYVESYNSWAFFDIKNQEGKRVGDASVYKDGDELYLSWIGVKTKHRGQGYATAILSAARDFGQEAGLKRMTLQVPGNSPDARHIYTQLGFRVTEEASSTNDYWGGLTSMVYEFDEPKKSLAHYGVPGMKWGKRRSDAELSRAKGRAEDSADYTIAKSAKQSTNRQLSNAQLKKVNERLQLEKSYKELTNAGPARKIKAGTATVSAIVAAGTLANTAIQVYNSPAGKAAISAGKTLITTAYIASKVLR